MLLKPCAREVWGGDRGPRTVWSTMAARQQEIQPTLRAQPSQRTHSRSFRRSEQPRSALPTLTQRARPPSPIFSPCSLVSAHPPLQSQTSQRKHFRRALLAALCTRARPSHLTRREPVLLLRASRLATPCQHAHSPILRPSHRKPSRRTPLATQCTHAGPSQLLLRWFVLLLRPSRLSTT